MEIRVLGPVELVGGGGVEIALQGNKMRGLLAALALEGGRPVSTERLIDILWGEQEISGANVVQVLVSKLRRIVANAGERELVTTAAAGYQLTAGAASVDLDAFVSLVDQARAAASEPGTSAALLGRAVRLWRGPPLGGTPDTEVLGGVRTRLWEMRNSAVDDLTDARLQLGRHHELAAELEQLVAEEPLRERRWAQLMRALYASGRQADAVRAFQRARDVLIDAVGAEPGPELRRLEAAVLAQDDAVLLPTVDTSAAPIGHGFRRQGNLRHPVSACIGRDAEVRHVIGLLADNRLVTLLGPGGVGKTRLAQEIGVSMSDVPDGVWWVDAIATRTEHDLVAAVQRALGIEGGPVTDVGAGLTVIATVLSGRRALVVVDNCEHVVDAARSIVEELLGRCPELSVLATSRERLDLLAERAVDVAPLRSDDAVALFRARMALDLPAGDDASEAVVRDICERLDRLPLAVELAAARTRYASLDELARRLADRFDALSAAGRAADGRRRDLRAVAAWSYELLDEQERVVFERLSVFSDGATAEAARVVCAGGTVAATEVESTLHRLVDKSLVVADRSATPTRFRMLQTLADFATERLQARGTVDHARRAHADWVAALAASVAFGAPTDGPTIAAVQVEDAAIRDAVQWALVHEPPIALKICDSLSAFWFGTMRVSSGWELLQAALDASTGLDAPADRASAQAWAAVFATMVQDPDAAGRHAEDALTFERSLGDPMRLGRATLMMALAAGYRNDGDWTRWISESRAHFAAAGLVSGTGHAAFAEGAVHLLAGDLGLAAERLRTAIDEFRRHRDHLGQILAVSRLGELAWRVGDVEQYGTLHAELRELGRSGRSPGVTIGATARLAHARLVAGDLAEAESLAREALAGSGSSFMPVINGYAFRSAGLVNLALGHTADGRRNLLDAIDAFSQGAGSLGVGQAAMCWIDLSRSHMAALEWDDAERTALAALDHARGSGEPWVCEQAQAHLDQLAAHPDREPS